MLFELPLPAYHPKLTQFKASVLLSISKPWLFISDAVAQLI
jgi:hypothetical protein